MIKNTDHCRLCNNHEPDIKHGFICRLNNKPPTFNKTCNTIEFDTVAHHRIKHIDLKRKKLYESKFDAYGGIVFWPLVGIAVHFINYYLFNYIYAKNAYSVLNIILFVVGIVLIGMGVGPFIEFKKQKEVVDNEIENTNSVLNLYQKKYIAEYYPKRNFLDTRIMLKSIRIEDK
ncbi:hypothetical protein [uncultured Tenacibaculum sp.]|uniref:hypothetical protein n=1 Tax=uncultured Tenacibaculum sp. TaxID=174713 RepID=UPI00263836A8|nr:hypothetical protein [uncultured Tenacibaculum sp.]